MVSRGEKEALLGQRGRVVWLYGLSGSGKSTLATALERQLHAEGRFAVILDGDNLRIGLNAGLGFGDEARWENIRRAAEVAKLFAANGVIVLASFICPKRELRHLAREVVGAQDFAEVYVQASFETCRQRDPKGLYARVEAGQVQQFTGRDSGFEPPEAADGAVVVDTEVLPLDAAAAFLRGELGL